MPPLAFRKIPALSGQTLPRPLGLRGFAWSAVTAFLVGSVAVAGGFATVASYARKETAVGYVSPVAGAVRVTGIRPGVLTHLAVANGQRVAAGDPLFTVETRHALESGGTLDAALRSALNQQADLLREQIAAEEGRAVSEIARLGSRLSGLEAERASLEVQRELQAERASVTGERLKALTDLRGKGFVSEAEYKAREEAWLAQRQNLAALEQRITALAADISQTRIQQAQLPADSADRIARLRGALTELSQRGAEVSAQGAQLVRAPLNGRITALQVSPGQYIDALKPVLTLVPEGSALRAELFVESRAIGFVEPGQRVRLKYDAFPFQRFGAYGGVVADVSETVLAPNEIIGPVRPERPTYRVTVALDRETVDAFGKQVPLQPDMTVMADIILENRSLMEWLLEPLFARTGRGL